MQKLKRAEIAEIAESCGQLLKFIRRAEFAESCGNFRKWYTLQKLHNFAEMVEIVTMCVNYIVCGNFGNRNTFRQLHKV